MDVGSRSNEQGQLTTSAKNGQIWGTRDGFGSEGLRRWMAGGASNRSMGNGSEVAVRSKPGELRLPPGPGVNLLTAVLQQKKWVDPIAHFTHLAEQLR